MIACILFCFTTPALDSRRFRLAVHRAKSEKDGQHHQHKHGFGAHRSFLAGASVAQELLRARLKLRFAQRAVPAQRLLSLATLASQRLAATGGCKDRLRGALTAGSSPCGPSTCSLRTRIDALPVSWARDRPSAPQSRTHSCPRHTKWSAHCAAKFSSAPDQSALRSWSRTGSATPRSLRSQP